MLTCEYCSAQARRNAGMAAHVSKRHPDKWVGSLKNSFTLGYNPGEQEPQRRKGKSRLTEEQKVIRRKQQKDWYDKNRRKRKPGEDSDRLEEPRGFINCCPNCGENLVAYYLAKGAMQRRAEVRV
jgi:hypothetical protein